MNSRACFDSDSGSPVSIESYGHLSDILPSPLSKRCESDRNDGKIRRKVINDDSSFNCSKCVEPVSTLCGSNEADFLFGAVDYDDDNPEMLVFNYGCDENMFWINGDTDPSDEIQLGRGMRSNRVHTLQMVDPLIKKEDPVRSRKSDRIDPPTKITNSFAKIITLRFFVILEVFALRCAFDHLRRATYRNFKNLSKLSRSSSLRFEQKQMEASFYNAPHIIKRMGYSVDQRRNRVLLVKTLRSWRAIAVTASKLRQKYYIMMIVNRWKLYTDECIDLRRKRDISLLHWATSICKKSFDVLKLHAINCKGERRLAIALQNKVRRVRLSCERDASLRFDAPSMPDSKFKVNPREVLSENLVPLARNYWFDSSTSTSNTRRNFLSQHSQPSPFLLSSLPSDKLTAVLAGIGKPRSRIFLGGQADSSVKNTKDYYQVRFLTASVVDDMISIIEHRDSAAGTGFSRRNQYRFRNAAPQNFHRRYLI
jgi:hypothetical protein